MATYNIIGYVRSLLSGKAVQNLTVTLYKPGGETSLATTNTKLYGQFQFVLEDDFFETNFTGGEEIALLFEVENEGGKILLSQDNSITWTPTILEDIFLYIDTEGFKSDNIYSVSGSIVHANNVPAEGMVVKAYQKLFNEDILLGESEVNDIGYYNVVYSHNLLNTVDINRTAVTVEVYDSLESILIANSDIYNFQESLVINISLEIDEATPYIFDNILGKVTSSIGETAIADITSEQIQQLSISIGAGVEDVSKIVKSYQLSNYIEATTDDDRKYMYALSDKYNLNDNTFFDINIAEVEDIVNEAISKKIIDVTAPDVASFVDKIKDAQVVALKAIPVNNETFTWNEVLLSIFETDENVNTFLQGYNEVRYDTEGSADFWNNVDATTQKGFKLIGLSGIQPQMITAMLGEVEEDDGVHALAEKDASEWLTFIEDVCTAASALCLPAAIKEGYDLEDSGDVALAKAEYATVLKNAFQEVYPLVPVRKYLGGENGDDIISDSGARGQVITFLQNNLDFDLRNTSVDNIDAEVHDLTDITDVDSLKEELLPFQRLFNVTGGKPDAVLAFISDGLTSANSVASLSEEDFVGSYSAIIGNESQAQQVFQQATGIAMVAEHATMGLTNLLQDNIDTTVIPQAVASSFYNDLVVNNPDLVTLFGNMNYCPCQHCISVYSPAAYLTDLLKFLKDKAVAVYEELNSRRPDIRYIDLSCKNTNTEIPYIDIVNEVLENFILERNGITMYPTAYQTMGTAAELKAHPEHVYWEMTGTPPTKEYKDSTAHYDVYDNRLSSARYPEGLPFSLALEETRTYFKNLGTSRLELMKMFKSVTATNDINDFSIAAEYLGISDNAAKIITIQSPYDTNIWEFYGFKVENSTGMPESGIIDPSDVTGGPKLGEWKALLCDRLDILIQQTRLSYHDFLEMLETDFINKNKKITITLNNDISTAPYSVTEDTCDLRYLKLNFTSPATSTKLLEKLYRFIRLWKSTTMSIYELDALLSRSLDIENFDAADFELLGRVLMLANKINMKPGELAMFWGGIDTRRYLNYNSSDLTELRSTYDAVYANKAVINIPIDQFIDPLDLPTAFTGQTSLIAAFSRIKESEVLSILSYLDIDIADPVTLAALSRIYFFGAFSKATAVPVESLLEIFKIFNSTTGPDIAALDGLTEDYPELLYLEGIIETVSLIRQSGFSFDELQFLIQDKGNKEKFGVNGKKIQAFYEGLRKDLTRFSVNEEGNFPEETFIQVKNAALQFFEKHFDIPLAVIKPILENIELERISSGTINIIDALIDPILIDFDFKTGTPPTTTPVDKALSLENLMLIEDIRGDIDNPPLPDFNLTDIYYSYYLVHKVIFTIKRLGISQPVFEYLFNNPDVIGFDMMGLPVDGELTESTIPLLNGLLLSAQWFRMQKSLNLSDDDFIELLSVSVAEPTDEITGNDLKQQWLDILGKNEKIEKVLTDLVGDSSTLSTAGAFRVTFNDDILPSSLNTIKTLTNIKSIANWVDYTELSVQKIYDVVEPELTLDDAHHVLLAAKAKYNNDTWLKIAKPLRDELRKKQRDALAQYSIANPDITHATRKKIWRNENELYAYFLIDVEMDPCMMTSRIRQALNAVQLMVDRVLLGIEFRNFDPGQRLSITGTALKQWEQWRKWYRVWEANRKVFLYPENWIEPDLRIGKSEFFEDLEADLKKDDFTDELAEDAYRNYLNKLAEVARLEPIGAFREYLDGDDDAYFFTKPVGNTLALGYQTLRAYKLHTFARTYSEPHKYFYRVLSEGEWSPWKNMDLDIQSDHIMPYMYNGKLYLFWLTFQKKRGWVNKYGYSAGSAWFQNNIGDVSKEDESSNPDYKPQPIMEITINWSEYKNGKWLQQKAGKDKMQIKLNPDIDRDIVYKMNHLSRELISQKHELTSFDVIKAQIHMSGSIYKPLNTLNITLTFPHHWENNDWNNHAYDKMRYLHGFIFKDSFSDPEVMRRDGLKSNFQAPYETSPINNKFVAKPISHNTDNIRPLTIHHTHPQQEYNYVYIWNISFQFPSHHYHVHKNSSLLLRNTPNGRYKITSIANFINEVYFTDNTINIYTGSGFEDYMSNNPLTWNFFYEDGKNTFFASNITRFNNANWTTYPYFVFKTFSHPYVKDFISTLNKGGISSFLNLSTQIKEENYFIWDYLNGYQNSLIHPTYPKNNIDFDYDGAYSCYNWELFFHIPLLIAQRLSDNQKFAEARKWYHYIFDPTSTTDENGAITSSKQRFWKFKPLYNHANNVITLNQLLAEISNQTAWAKEQVVKWENNPFDPHAIGRLRRVAYMKNVVMKYLDNLIAWGDKLFKQDTTESINEATQLYILAANILGNRPQEIPARVKVGSKAFAEIEGSLDDFSNAKVTIEKFIGPNVPKVANGTLPTAFYFCVPNNEKLIAYWDTVADRLYKIRHCMNISGQVRSLSLFGSPIDPALLVKAAAAGVDTATLLDGLSGPASYYRFTYILQKANELCGDVKALGGALLSALEKKDAEALALLRSSHEIAVLEKVKQVKEIQIQEAEANIEALVKSKDTIVTRQQYYLSRVYINAQEREALKLSEHAMVLQNISGNISALGSALGGIPEFSLLAPFSIGPTFGGANLSAIMQGASTKISTMAGVANAKASKASTMAGYIRRNEDWQFQAQLAVKELEQIDKQVTALEIRKSIAEKELENHKLQMENTTAVDEYMRSKFTNEELYSWMISQISTTYFQSYQLAYNMAKTAERCFDYELPFAQKAKAGYIQYGYWDSLKKGLLAGEKLQYDLRKLEGAYIEGNTRDREITKHVSLVLTDPEQLIQLRDTGNCTFNIPEWLYDLDYPGHYHRRIKSVSITIPCVAGPYTSVSCELGLSSHTSYDKDGQAVTIPGDAPFKEIATSSAQNDNGMFELNFKDERYIPFEGCGAESSWSISLMDVEELRQFVFTTISDVILHIKYTAQTSGAFNSDKANTSKTTLQNILNGADISEEEGLQTVQLPRYFSLRHEFSRELHMGFSQLSDIVFDGDPVADIARLVTVNIKHDHFPYFCRNRELKISKINFFIKTSTGIEQFGIYIPAIDMVPAAEINTGAFYGYLSGVYDATSSGLIIAPNSSKQIPLNIFQIVETESATINESDIDDIFMVFEYNVVAS